MKGDNSGIVQDKDLREISKDIGKDGEFLGRSLGLQEEEIELIREDNPRNSRERNYRILKKWSDKDGSKATYKRLNEAFQEIDKKNLAEKYSKRQPVKEPAKNKQRRKRPSSSNTTEPAPKRQKTSMNSTSTKDQTTKKEPAENKQRKRPSSSVKKTATPKIQKKGPAKPKPLNSAKGNVGGPNTGQKSSTFSNIALKIIHKEEKGYPKPNPDTGTWFRGKFTAANESNWFSVTIWGDQGKEKMTLFKKDHCVVLKGVSIKGNEISFGQGSKVETHGTPIIVGEDVLRKIKKHEKKSYQTLEEIKKSGNPSKTKLRVCEVIGECKPIKKKDGTKTVLRNLKVRNKKSKKNPGEALILYGPDARRTKEGQTIVLNVWYNTEKKEFQNKGNYIMKIIKKSKKGKPKKRKQKSK